MIADSVHVLSLTPLATRLELEALFAKMRNVALVTAPFNPCTVKRR